MGETRNGRLNGNFHGIEGYGHGQTPGFNQSKRGFRLVGAIHDINMERSHQPNLWIQL
jgi:hypothetical protein